MTMFSAVLQRARLRRGLLRRAICAAALAAIAAVAAGEPAHAQYGEVFGNIRPGPGDRQIMRERVQTLLDGPAEPRTIEWANARSGNGGTLALMRTVTRGARECRQIEYRIRPRAMDQDEVAILLWCKQPTGRWALYS